MADDGKVSNYAILCHTLRINQNVMVVYFVIMCTWDYIHGQLGNDTLACIL